MFVFLTPCINAQNYPLLLPGFLPEEENLDAKRDTERLKINSITMYWEGALPQRQKKKGEQLILTLRAVNWHSQQPPSGLFMPPVPQGVILSSMELSAEDRANGIVVKIKIIFLTDEDIVFPARTLIFENTHFIIPLLRL